jgi:signal transduction histidine kinase
VQIDYAGLSFAAQAKVHYRYILEGFDADWVDAGIRRTALYTNLSPGRHRFRVKATADGGWTENDTLVDFSIEPTFYQTRKFQIASISMLPLAILAIWQFRVRRIRKQFSLVLAERTRMAREIHDTLLQSLVAVTLELEVLATQLGPVSNSTTDSIRRLRMRLEEHLRDARQAINNLRTVTCSDRDFPTRLKQAAEQLTAGTLVRFEFVMHGQYCSCSAHVEEQLLRIGQEAIINAIRHGQPNRIRLEVHYDDESVSLRISDDGSGFSPRPPDGQGHWGLVTMRERAEGIGGRLKLRSEPGGGTDVETVVPYA